MRAAPTVAVPSPAAPRVEPLTAGELAVVALATLLPLAASPLVYSWFFTPKAALLLPALGPGALALVAAVRAGDRAARAGGLFLAVAGAATLLAPAPALALVGLANAGTGWLFVLACVGGWALGRRLGSVARHRLADGLLLAAGVTAVISWWQTSVAVPLPMLEPTFERAGALLGNPVHVATFCAAALCLVVPRIARARATPWEWWAVAALLAGAVERSGGRLGLVLAVVALAWGTVRLGLRRGGHLLAAAALGVVLAGSLGAIEGAGATTRVVADAGSGLDGRVARYQLGLEALRERPVLGVGPGQFRRATSPHTTPQAARAFGADALSDDAHNLVVEYAVTTGILGLVALVAWLVLAGRRARGPLAALAAVGGLALALQPQSIGLTPVLAIALGAAAPRAAPPFTSALRHGAVVLAAIGVSIAVLLVSAEVMLERAYNDVEPRAARAAASLTPWPLAPRVESRASAVNGVEDRDRAAQRAALAAARAAVDRDPTDPRSWNDLAALEAVWGSPARATAAYEQALHWNPWSVRALRGSAELAAAAGVDDEVALACARARRVGARGTCP